MKNTKGITLIALVVTIVVLLILASITMYFMFSNGTIDKAQEAKTETIKQTATEKINLKITNIQIQSYAKKQEMPTLQELADGLVIDEEIQYVELASKKIGSLEKVNVGENESIFTKLKEYPYEFEINSSLQLASVDGVQVAQTTSKEEIQKIIDDSMKINYEEIFSGKAETKLQSYALTKPITDYKMLIVYAKSEERDEAFSIIMTDSIQNQTFVTSEFFSTQYNYSIQYTFQNNNIVICNNFKAGYTVTPYIYRIIGIK